MPKNKGLGGKKFRSSKKISEVSSGKERQLEYKQVGQEYAKVIQILGDKRVKVLTNECKEQLCIIPGGFKKKKIWIGKDDIVLITIRDYQDDRSDIIYKYEPNEVKQLFKLKELNSKLATIIGDSGGNSSHNPNNPNNNADDDDINFQDDVENENVVKPQRAIDISLEDL